MEECRMQGNKIGIFKHELKHKGILQAHTNAR